MVCTAIISSFGMILGGWTLLIRDRWSAKLVSWGILISYIGLWVLWSKRGQDPTFRHVLEYPGLGTLVVAAHYRLRHLMRTCGIYPPWYEEITSFLRKAAMYLTPQIWLCKGWLLSMVINTAFGVATYPWSQYVTLGVIALLFTLHRQWQLIKKRNDPFAVLEEGGDGPQCPVTNPV